MTEFILRGQCPSGKNAVMITRSGHRYPGKRFVAWRESAKFMVPKLQIGPLAEPLMITIRYYPGDLRRRDAPGMLDALFHLFEYTGLVADDKFFQEIDWKQMGLDRGNPRCEIIISLISAQ